MINILCFGDSNTFGSNPAGGRWPLHKRWTSVLQDLLGEEFHVIEEGCGGRTTVMEDFLEQLAGRPSIVTQDDVFKATYETLAADHTVQVIRK